MIYKNYLQLYLLSHQLWTCQVYVKMTSKQEAYIEYDTSPSHDLPGPPLHIISYFDSSKPTFLKHLRLLKRKGTGIEYGF